MLQNIEGDSAFLFCFCHFSVKPWSNGLASTSKQLQVELAKRLALDGQTDWQVSSQVHESRKKKAISRLRAQSLNSR